ncbi:hypothetical protein D3C87_1688400 [compost metagenome]
MVVLRKFKIKVECLAWLLADNTFFKAGNKRVTSECQVIVRTCATIKSNVVFLANEINNCFVTIFCSAFNVFLLSKVSPHTFDNFIDIFCGNGCLFFLSTKFLVVTQCNRWNDLSLSCKF